MRQVKVFLCDCDGTLTDGGMYYLENGQQFKKFSVADGIGFELLKAAGIKTGILTGEITPIVEHRAKKLKLDYLYQGCSPQGKLEAARAICALEKISLEQVAYVGDDVNDLPLLEQVGLKACVQNAQESLKTLPGVVILKHKGGEGAVRELINSILGPQILEEC
ncbi:KdsC family phosphatase [Helicobacter salomonis]|uniref:KdsC family phosphatase n=1 Tax=Helicobacter salomonis TaxID=56878 RepID=UPI000CF16DB9|nr:HAD family hydrolase [Helicobacter salomonis]